MKIKFLILIFFLPLAAFAQSKKIFEITKDESQLIQGDGQDSLFKVLLYAPDFRDGLKIKSTKGWIRDKVPSYNETSESWELFFPLKTINEIKINFSGFLQETIIIENPPIATRVISYNVFEKQKDRNANPILMINSDPSEASIFIESIPQGKIILSEKETPFETKNLLADSVRIQLEKEGFYKIDTTLKLKKGEAYSLDFKLDPIVKEVEIKTKPFDAALVLNGEPVLNPFFGTLSLGTYNLTMNKKFFHDKTVVFDLNEGDSLKILNFEMDPKLSSITFPPLAKLDGARVFIDGVQSPIVNGVIKEVAFGTRTIKVEKSNLYPFSKDLLVENENIAIPVEFFSTLSKNELGKKTAKRISLGLGFGAIGAGLYLMQSANKNYAAYQKADSSTEAASLRKQVESADQLAPIVFGLGGLFIGIQFLF
jgi:hypothetical protein